MCVLISQIKSQADLPLEKVFEQFGGFEADSLKAIASNPKQMKFLKILSNAQQLIVWLRKETKSTVQLH